MQRDELPFISMGSRMARRRTVFMKQNHGRESRDERSESPKRESPPLARVPRVKKDINLGTDELEEAEFYFMERPPTSSNKVMPNSGQAMRISSVEPSSRAPFLNSAQRKNV